MIQRFLFKFLDSSNFEKLFGSMHIKWFPFLFLFTSLVGFFDPFDGLVQRPTKFFWKGIDPFLAGMVIENLYFIWLIFCCNKYLIIYTLTLFQKVQWDVVFILIEWVGIRTSCIRCTKFCQAVSCFSINSTLLQNVNPSGNSQLPTTSLLQPQKICISWENIVVFFFFLI
jgi:membrane-associated phospholipid phosphatase